MTAFTEFIPAEPPKKSQIARARNYPRHSHPSAALFLGDVCSIIGTLDPDDTVTEERREMKLRAGAIPRPREETRWTIIPRRWVRARCDATARWRKKTRKRHLLRRSCGPVSANSANAGCGAKILRRYCDGHELHWIPPRVI